jgi:hypothetical protein
MASGLPQDNPFFRLISHIIAIHYNVTFILPYENICNIINLFNPSSPAQPQLLVTIFRLLKKNPVNVESEWHLQGSSTV